MGPTTPPGTTLVPTAASHVSRTSTPGDAGDGGDAPGRIYALRTSAGGRAVAGSNPVAPIDESPLWKRDLGERGDGRGNVARPVEAATATTALLSTRPASRIRLREFLRSVHVLESRSLPFEPIAIDRKGTNKSALRLALLEEARRSPSCLRQLAQRSEASGRSTATPSMSACREQEQRGDQPTVSPAAAAIIA